MTWHDAESNPPPTNVVVFLAYKSPDSVSSSGVVSFAGRRVALAVFNREARYMGLSDASDIEYAHPLAWCEIDYPTPPVQRWVDPDE